MLSTDALIPKNHNKTDIFYRVIAFNLFINQLQVDNNP